MAETTGTLTDAGRASEPGTAGPNTTDDGTTVVLPAGDASPGTGTPTVLDAELAELRAQNARLKQQVNGSAQEALRLKQEREAIQSRLEAIERSLQTSRVPGAPVEDDDEAEVQELDTLLTGWLNNDKDAVRKIAKKLKGPAQGTFKPEQVQQLVQHELETRQTKAQLQQAIVTRHPEINKADDPIYQDVYDNYETYAADPTLQMLFPPDASLLAGLRAPDGSGAKNVDLRVLNELMNRAKMARGVQQGRREEREAQDIGDVTGSVTPSRRGGQKQNVEALDLLSPGMVAQIDAMIASRSIPTGWPKTTKGIAKKLYDLSSDTEKAAMVAEYQRRSRSVA